MVSRRLIRIKVFKLLFSRVHSQSIDVASAEEELFLSLDKTRQLYFLLMALPQALARYAQERIDIGLQKFHPTAVEAAPNRRFADNKAIALLSKDKTLYQQQEHGLNWADYRAFIKHTYEELKEQDFFLSYMESAQEPSFEDDVNLLKGIYSCLLDDNDELDGILEDQSLYWIDDVAYVCNIILGVLPTMKATDISVKHPVLFRQEDDRMFAKTLLMQALSHYEEYAGYIDKFADNWELERIAATDTTLIVLGIAEAVAFPSIPVKVTLNEVVEISKFYSTGNSRQFVNGVLDRILKQLIEEHIVNKQGRGLVDK